jgi:ribonuclease E
MPVPHLDARPKETMAQKMLIDATHAEETRVVVVDGSRVEEFDFESHSKRQLTGNIYLAKVTRVEPSLQAAFVEYGGNRHGFLAFSEIHPDYYQIPKEDREALLAEEAAFARDADDENGRERGGRDKTGRDKPKGRSRTRRRSAATTEGTASAVVAAESVTEGGSPSAAGDFPGDAAEDFADAPPPSAASGEIDIDVPEEPEEAVQQEANGKGANGSANGEAGDYESVGGDDVDEERSRPRARPMRRYKIQEVIKVRQILLVQVVKEERGNKGAALTTYLSLAGRYCVLMPNTARGGGISRKITQAADRKKLKDIASSLTVPEGAGLIIRTAGAQRTKTEIKRDYEYLLRAWEQVRDLTLKSIAPCLIYEEGSLIKRAIRDLYSRDIDEILVDGERGYREAKDYMKMLMPSHAKNVKHYAEALPLYSRHQVEGYLAGMFNPVVQLKSGGYIVIDVTEALVAIDVNSGRATREASIEETALKTNLEAAEEAARQMRLRDLAGLIVIDFIDMDERRNNAAVEKRLKERLKSDRARIQIGRISAFGLLEMSRQRLRPGMIEATTKSCPHCHGTGRVRSDDSMALALLRELEEEGVRQRSKEVLIVAPVEIANYLLNQKREHVALIEARFGLSVRVEGDPSLISPDYRVERFKTASRIINVPEQVLLPIAADDVEEDEAAEAEASDEAAEERSDAGDGGDRSGKRRRRRRRRGGRNETDARPHRTEDAAEDTSSTAPAALPEGEGAAEAAPAAAAPDGEPDPNKRRSRRRPRARPADADEAEAAPELASAVAEREDGGTSATAPAEATTPFDLVIDVTEERSDSGVVDVPETDAPQRPRRERVRKPVVAVLAEVPTVTRSAAEPPAETESSEAPAAEAPVEEPEPSAETEAADERSADERPAADATEEAAANGDEPSFTEPVAGDGETRGEEPERPRRRGWWSRALGGS